MHIKSRGPLKPLEQRGIDNKPIFELKWILLKYTQFKRQNKRNKE